MNNNMQTVQGQVQISTGDLKKRVKSEIGTVYVITLFILGAIADLVFPKSIIGLILNIVSPIIAAILLNEMNLKFTRKYINRSNWAEVRKSVIYILVLVDLLSFLGSWVLFVSGIVANIMIISYLKPKIN